MKKLFIFSLLSLVTSAAFGTIVGEFQGWEELIQDSPNIIVAQCTATFDRTNPTNRIFTWGQVPAKIEVISVLKGDTKPEPSRLLSAYWPYAGQKLLIFGRYQQDRNFTGYGAPEDYRVIPLNHDFVTNVLGGKTLEDQIRWILNSRLHDLKDELAKGDEEKKRLEEGFPVATNVNYRIQREQAEKKKEEEEIKQLKPGL